MRTPYRETHARQLPVRLLACAVLALLLPACAQGSAVPAPPVRTAAPPAATESAITQQPTSTSQPAAMQSPRRVELTPHVTAMGGAVFDQDGNLLVGDADADLIYKFDPNGKMLMKFGGHGKGDGEFQFWNDSHEANGGYMAVDPQGNIFVADFGNNRIQKFNSKGEYMMQWGKRGEKDGEMTGPYNISTDAQGNVYVSDSQTKRVQKFDNNGQFIAIAAKDLGQTARRSERGRPIPWIGTATFTLEHGAARFTNLIRGESKCRAGATTSKICAPAFAHVHR